MTAKTARKQLSIFLSMAISSSVANAQSTDTLGLALEAVPTITLGPQSDNGEAAIEESVARPGQPTVVMPVSPPTRIERSVLDTPSVHHVSPIAPLSEDQGPESGRPERSGSVGEKSASEASAARQVLSGTAELIRGRFPDGKPQVERWVGEDAQGNIVNHGKYVEYDVAGTVIASGNYVLGEREGEWSKQLSAEEVQGLVGQIDKGFKAPFVSQASFQRDKLHGDWTILDSQGRTISVWTYRTGARQGESVQFDSAGEITQSITYKDNLADGPARMPADGGVKETAFFDGRMLRQVDKWYPAVAGKSRVLQAQEWQLVPMPLNVASSDWANCRVEYRPTAGIEPIRHGMAVTFYPNGQRESEGSYEHGKRTGTFAWWYSNGQQKTVGEYRDDVEQNAWTWWHENGMKHVTGMFVDGRQVDEWSRWSSEGKLVDRAKAPGRAQIAERGSSEGAPQLR